MELRIVEVMLLQKISKDQWTSYDIFCYYNFALSNNYFKTEELENEKVFRHFSQQNNTISKCET